MSGFSSIDPQSLAALSSGGSCKIVDVRTHQEVLQGRIEGALHIPLHELAQRFTEIGADQPVVFYCQSGARSLQASAFLAARGWVHVYNLAGGMLAWARSGLPIATEDR